MPPPPGSRTGLAEALRSFPESRSGQLPAVDLDLSVAGGGRPSRPRNRHGTRRSSAIRGPLQVPVPAPPLQRQVEQDAQQQQQRQPVRSRSSASTRATGSRTPRTRAPRTSAAQRSSISRPTSTCPPS